MNRRGFFKLTVGGVSTAAAVRTFPFRVFSFPSEIKIAREPFIEPPKLSLGFRIPVRIEQIPLSQFSFDGDHLGRGSQTTWRAVDIHTPEEMEKTIAEYAHTQDSGWAARVRELAPWGSKEAESRLFRHMGGHG
jgi:hypothetical protein